MQAALEKVKTIVLVMMENRSFDHMLGHRTIDNPNLPVNGLRTPLDPYGNEYNGTLYPCFIRDNDNELPFDIPHEYDYVSMQLRQNPVSGNFTMKGFVEAYAKSSNVEPNVQCDPMGIFPSQFVPLTDFLADHFCICDNWYAPIPTSTQPNRTMAFSGESAIYETKAQLISLTNDIFHWMDKRGIRWRVYHEGFSFFSLYHELWPYVLGEQFRRYEYLHADMMNESEENGPQVIVIEPCYQDAPHFGSKYPDDNHAPLAIAWGEDFLRRTYQAITANPSKWASTVMLVYYDEHGGFYDHQEPPKIPYTTTGSVTHQFESLGPRIPGLVVSPFVKPGSVCSELFDHTSVLQMIAEKFSPNEEYSASVAKRKEYKIKSLSVALTILEPVSVPNPPNFEVKATTTLGKSLTTPPQSEMGKSFEIAGAQMIAQKPAEVARKYPELYQWKDTAAKMEVQPVVKIVSLKKARKKKK